METQKTKVQIPREFSRIFAKDWRHAVIEGGRYSLKSHTAARAVLLRSRQEKIRIACLRQFQKNINDSSYQLLLDLIDKYGFEDFTYTKDSIINTVTGSNFIFKGLDRNVETTIKSLEGIDLVWVDEAQTITRNSIRILVPTVRKPGSQIIWTMNRLTDLDPVLDYFITNPPRKDVWHLEVDYTVAQKNGWLSDEILYEIEQSRLNHPEEYAHDYLGKAMNISDKNIIPVSFVLKAMSQEVSDEGAIEVGVDVARMGGDRTVFVMRKGMSEVKRVSYTKKRTTEVCDLLENFVDMNKECLIKIDDTGVGCITHDTSILTPDGWKYPTELVEGDIVYTKDDNGDVTTTTVFSVDERETDIIEAGGYKFAWAHQLPTKTRNNNAFKMRTWQQALENKTAIFDTVFNYSEEQSDFIMPVQSIEMPNGGEKIINDEIYVDGEEFARLLGWYVSEGSLDRSSGCIRITQIKTQHFDEIERVMSYFGKVVRNKNDFVVFNKALYKWLDKYCYKGGSGFKYKTIPRWVTNNSVNVIQAFLEAFRYGDGYIHHGRNYYVTSSVNLPNDLIELIYKTGKSAGVYKKSDAGSAFEIEGRTAIRTEDNYVVFEYARNNYGISGKEASTYAGKVYSIILNNDTKMMFTKVDGQKPFWTHNGGVTDEMKKRGYNVMAINFGAKAVDSDKYPNLISEAWFYMQSIMEDISLANSKDLLTELSSRQWKMDKQGRRGVESKDDYKKRGYRSPDEADATILCFYTPEIKKIDWSEWTVK